MMQQPTTFPTDKTATFMLAGPIGELEVATSLPQVPSIAGTALVLHPHSLYGGSFSNKVVTTVAKAFNQLGLKVVRFNFRSVGKSVGQFDKGVGEVEDTLAVLNWVKSVAPHDAIWLAGFSFGSYVALKTAQRWPLKQLTLIAPPVNHFDFATTQQLPVPTLVIQGDQDEVVPTDEVTAWVNQVRPQPNYQIFPGCTHFFHGRLTELAACIIDNTRVTDKK